MSQDWTAGLSFIASPKTIEHQVGSDKWKFVPCSAVKLIELRNIVEPLSKAISTLTGDRTSDAAQTHRTVNGEGGGNEIIMEATPEATLKLRARQREEAIDKLVKAVMDKKNLEAIGSIILNSLRKQAPFEGNDCPPASSFVEKMPLPNLIECVIGCVKANDGVFRPLGLSDQGLTEKVQSMVAGKIGQAVDQTVNPAQAVATNAGTVVGAKTAPAATTPGSS